MLILNIHVHVKAAFFDGELQTDCEDWKGTKCNCAKALMQSLGGCSSFRKYSESIVSWVSTVASSNSSWYEHNCADLPTFAIWETPSESEKSAIGIKWWIFGLSSNTQSAQCPILKYTVFPPFRGSAGTFICKVNEMGLRSKEDDGAYHCALLLSLLMTHPSRNL